MSRSWIQTLGGRKLEPLALTVEMVGPIEEIAHSLARECRFTRQCPEFYSVAQHCCFGADHLPTAFAGAFLLHELSEVYLPDIASPLKPSLFVDVTARTADFEGYEVQCTGGRSFVPWSALERQHTRVILQSLGLSSIEPLIYSPEVKAMDLAMLSAEKQSFFKTHPEPWGLPPPAFDWEIAPWEPRRAAIEFLERFHRYFGI